MDYKETLLLPQTTFPMRANLPDNEPKTYQKWKQQQAYKKMQNIRKNAKQSFSLHDGPPYANGHLHIGHALNKILKDIIIKLHYFNGYQIYYTPGWDCHGLPIEQQVEKDLGKTNKDNIEKSKIRQLCRDHAEKFLQIQSDEFQKLGVLGNFTYPYKTMNFDFETNIYKVLCEILNKGLLVRRSKPIYWSWACQTALADAEVEYKDKVSDSIYVAFNLDTQSCKKLNVQKASAVIWTTTPWTLPANQAICINPNEEYVITQEGLIFAKSLLKNMIQEGLTKGQIMQTYNARNLEYLKAINPLNQRESVLILAEYVSTESGSGLVHCAPGHGEEDYYACLKYNIETIMPVDDRGCYTKQIEQLLDKEISKNFIGMHIFKAQAKILELLGTHLLKHQKITHSYPHCWRSHEPVIYRATNQWFIVMDKPFMHGKTLREVALQAIDNTTFYPSSGKNRIRTMVEKRPDWCISRQRDWGVPIAFFIHKNTKEIIMDTEVLEHISTMFQQYGCDIWWDKSISELLPKSWQDKAPDLEKCTNILDVWFDSGSTWFAVLKSKIYDAGDYPADMYLEGSDQHRGWFQSSLLLSCILEGKAPYKSVLTHGFTMDEKGEKMSKSKGNVILPQQVIKEYGSEILRLWVALSDYQNDQKISKNILQQTSDQYKKIRNTIRFLMANINDLESLVGNQNLSLIDRYILKRAKQTFDTTRKNFNIYNFAQGFGVLMNFITNELSGIYLDLCKDSLYCDKKDSIERRSHQSVMAIILSHLCHILAPILTYTIDEVLTCGVKIFQTNNVFELEPLDIAYFNTDIKHTNFEMLLKIRSEFNEKLDLLKKQKLIKSGLELCVKGDFNCFKESSKWLIVSDFEGNEKIQSFKIDEKEFTIYKSAGYKCPRCWRFMSESEEHLCQRCARVLTK